MDDLFFSKKTKQKKNLEIGFTFTSSVNYTHLVRKWTLYLSCAAKGLFRDVIPDMSCGFMKLGEEKERRRVEKSSALQAHIWNQVIEYLTCHPLPLFSVPHIMFSST